MSKLDEHFLAFESKAHPMHMAILVEMEEDSEPLSLEGVRIRAHERAPQFERFHTSVARGTWRRPVTTRFGGFDSLHNIDVIPSADESDTMSVVSWLMSTTLVRGRPLWHISLINQRLPRRQYVVARIHHCMADAVSAVGFAALLLDGSGGGLSEYRRFLDGGAFDVGRAGSTAAVRAIKSFTSSWLEGRKAKGLGRVSANCDRDVHVFSLSTAELRERCREHSSTNFELVLAAVGVAMSKCPPAGRNDLTTVRTTIPVTLDPELRHAGNALSIGIVNIRADTIDLNTQILHIRDQLARVHAGNQGLAPHVVSQGITLPWLLEKWLARGFLSFVGAGLEVGISPAFWRPDAILGRNVTAVYPIGPLVGFPLSITGLVMGDRFTFGVVVDKASFGLYARIISAELQRILRPDALGLATAGEAAPNAL